MAILKVANTHFDTSGSNRLEYQGNNTIRLVSNGALLIPSGNTSQRPVSANGIVRFNTDSSFIEFYNGTAWTNVSTGTVNTIPAFTQANNAYTQANAAYARANLSSNTFSSNVVISVNDSANAALRITQTGTGHALLVEDESPDTSPFVITSNGRVGIGTTEIPSTLAVNGTVTIANTGHLRIENGATLQSKNTAGFYQTFLWPIWTDEITYLNYAKNGFLIRTNDSNTTMFLSNTGRVGIGTAVPSNLFEVIGGSKSEVVGYFYNANTSGDAVATVSCESGRGVGIQLQTYQTSTFLNCYTNHPLIFKTNNTDRVTIDASGNVSFTGIISATGRQTLYVPHSAMTARANSGAGSSSLLMSSNFNTWNSLAFDTSVTEHAQFPVWFPKSWDRGTVSFQPIWSHPTTATNFGVVWAMRGVAFSNGDTQDVAFGTAQLSSDTGATANTVYIGPESSAITIAGSPAEDDCVLFEIYRDVANGGDTLAVDARLHGVRIFYNTTKLSDN